MVVVGSRVAKESEARVCESHLGGREGSSFNANQFRSPAARGEDTSPSRAPTDKTDTHPRMR